jgi:PIN domain nuclease of toxin-antitoxin system
VDLLDASALIAFLNAEVAAPEVRRVLADADSRVTTVQLAEVADVLVRRHGVGSVEARRAVEAIPGLSVVAVGAAEGWRAGELRARHYHRTRCPVSLADCVLVAAAGPHDRIATSDTALAAVARAEGIGVFPLPSSA